MKYIEFSSSEHRAFFAEHGLTDFDAFFGHAQGQQINKNTKRNVVVMELDSPSGRQVFYMKRFHDPHFKDMLFALRNHGRLCSQGQLEWNNAHYLISHGIPTYRPVCFGQETRFGIERQSFFVTEQLEGDCLTDFLSDHWSDLSQPQQENLIRQIAAFFAKIHTSKISLPDSYVWHLFVNGNPGGKDIDLSIIDLHRMSIRVHGHASAANNLGAFLYSMPEHLFDTNRRNLFIQTYLKNSPLKNQTAFLKAMRRREQKLTRRRGKPAILTNTVNAR